MKTILTVALAISVLFCQAQEKPAVKTFYVHDKNSNFAEVSQAKRVNVIDSADYIRTVSEQKNNENLYDVTEYYLDKKVKKIGNSLNNGFAPQYNGNVISYYKNGNKAAEELFVKGAHRGISTYYFANTQLKKRINYSFDKTKRVEQVLELNDSLGNRFLDEVGTGSFKTNENDVLVEGTYTNGLKDKTWKTVISSGNVTYLDEYKVGEFMSGKTIDKNGKTSSYDKLETLPTFKGGIQAFGSFLSSNLRYPAEARDNNVQGRVFIQFVIEKDGSLTEAKVIRGVGSGCDEEALRVINRSPKWNPGEQRGVPVRVSYTVPIFFQLMGPKPKREADGVGSRPPFGGAR